ncbi:MAG: hypothetical protein VX768_20240 [Planctomycetota bacterium]|nr:hypothetical protein [Planctomycetota bacterium]
MKRQRVIKVGGSLLDLPDLRKRILDWIEKAEPRRNVFLVGGGGLCNEFRSLDARYQLGEGFSHDRCLELMSVTAQVLGKIMGKRVVHSFSQLSVEDEDVVFDCRSWLQAKGETIPRNWGLTSDSISALVARELDCSRSETGTVPKGIDVELCLFRSIRSNRDTDDCFEEFSRGLNVRLINLRQVAD